MSRVKALRAEVRVFPTDAHEADGTFAWDETTMVLVHATSDDGAEGLGYTYAAGAAAELVTGPLAKAVVGTDVDATSAAYAAMGRAMRNIGRPGLGWEAISAVDIALWDLKAKRLGVSLATLLGPARKRVPAYGSGGFTSYSDAQLAAQLGGWAKAGFGAVKMKVGTDPSRDVHRVRVAREAIGEGVALFVDANGAWSRKQALAQAALFARFGVTWLEEPVSSDDTDGLRLVRDRAPAGMEVTAGEYGYVPSDFRRLLVADCLDVVQADATRCGGVSGIMAVAAACEMFGVPLSTHCAPLVHAHVGAAIRPLRHIEWFHDHARIEETLFEGGVRLEGGAVEMEASRPGLGVTLRTRK